MRRETIEVIIGLLVLILAATPIVLLAAGSRKPEATARTYVVHARFNKVGGIQPGNEVQIGGIRVGTPEFRRLRRAMFLGGFATFSLLYCVQPLLPLFSHDWQVSPAQASTVATSCTRAV